MTPKRLPFAVMLLVPDMESPHHAVATPPDEYVARAMKEFHLPGLVLLVKRDGQVAKAAVYGSADTERKTLVDTGNTNSRSDRSAKLAHRPPVSCNGSARDRMVVSLWTIQSPTAVPDAPLSWAPMRVRHLLSHTAGLVRESPTFDPMKATSDADIVRGAIPATPRLRARLEVGIFQCWV